MTKMNKKRKMATYVTQRAVWRNGGCGSLESIIKQQVKWLVASVGSLPLRQAATTLGASGGQHNRKRLNVNANNRSERAEPKNISPKSVAKSPENFT